MDPSLAGFLGGLIPAAIAICVAVYQARKVRQATRGTVYAFYAQSKVIEVRELDDLHEAQRLFGDDDGCY